MIKIIITYSVTFFLNLILCCSTYANWSSDITLANNYLFNGLSQTDDNAALQASITWSGEHGIMRALGYPMLIILMVPIQS